MAKSQVFWTDFRTPMYGENLPAKFKRLLKTAGIGDIDLDGKFVAIKMHFGELGNLSFLRPNYARAVVDVVKSLGGKPFLTDCNTLYPGFRKNALEHLECAWQNGFTPYTVGCPIIIGDGLKGTDDVAVPVQGGTTCALRASRISTTSSATIVRPSTGSPASLTPKRSVWAAESTSW